MTQSVIAQQRIGSTAVSLGLRIASRQAVFSIIRQPRSLDRPPAGPIILFSTHALVRVFEVSHHGEDDSRFLR
jgi:hypothetical protein